MASPSLVNKAAMLLVITSLSGPAWGMATLFDDDFDDGTLGANGLGVGGGFVSVDNGFAPIGSSSESDSQAKIVEGGTANRHGIESINAFDLSDDSLSHTITWQIAGWAASGNSGARRIGLGLKSYPESLPIPEDSSSLNISVDEKDNHLSFSYLQRESAVLTSHAATNFDLDGNFSGDPDGFTLTLTVDATGYSISTVGLNTSSQVNLSGAWSGLSNGGADFSNALGTDGPMFVNASIQNQNFTGATLDVDRITVVQAEPVMVGSILEWNSIDANGGQSLFLESNWIDPLTGQSPMDPNTIAANLEVNRSLVIRRGTVGGGGGAVGNLLMGLGDLSLTTATLKMKEGFGIDMGSGDQGVTLVDAEIISDSLTNGRVVMDGYSEMTLSGADPLNGSTVDLLSTDCFVHLLDILPSQMLSSQLGKFTVNGAAAVSGNNVVVSQYYNGSVIRPKLGNDQVMKGFDGADLTGTKWNFSTGFKGRVGAGLIAHNAGIYNVDGWGSDIWGTADQCRFTYRDMSGDAEIIAKIAWVQDTHVWAKGGVMFRSDLTAGSPNAFVFQRPDKQITFQTRTAAGGATTSAGPVGGTGAVKWVRLVRSGNDFSGYYSTNSASGPWTQVGTTTSITMPTAAKAGIAATSHLGLERGRTNFHEVSTVPASPSSDIGIFDESVDLESPWWIENRISSFLLKKGYMVTLSTKGGGQGVSQVFIATEGDLKVNLPATLDNQVCCMRVLPWRWIAKRGWGGSRTDHQTLLRTYWNYEWEPTGDSGTNREFVPMIRGRGQDKEFRWLEVRARGAQTHFLCFNEPESANQGDLSVDEAIALYPKALQLGLRIGSPARTDGSNGDNWLKDFMSKADAKGYRVDFVCVHNYNKKTAASLKTWLDAEYAKYGRPIWLTEFQRDVGDNPTSAQHEAYLAEVMPMLESLSYLERYAYYTFNTANPSNEFASLFDNGPVLNAKGQIYREIVSNPGYVNAQPAWATATLDLPSGSIMQSGDSGMITANTSIDSSKVSKVEFFVNGVSVGSDSNSPYQFSTDSLGQGLQSVHSIVTTNFGEQITSASSQVFVTDFEFLTLLPGVAGEMSWSAVPGETYHFESSDDLSTWTEIEQRIATGFQETVSDPAWGTESKKFYRVRW